MLTLIFAAVLVGFPAGVGAYLFVNPSSDRDLIASSVLLFYAAVLGATFVLLLPHGILIRRAVWLEMPVAFVLGCAVGGLTGLIRRNNGK
ncbi:hypothetical protein [Ruegeria sp. HKCCSP335]|uniref:hypothetical protein n=1 Tax=Ruegeria sp. HKCCSP335 TaxID=2794833 RepID=UPI001AE87229|nr:hypothetical protein [Ruegeria sp. HKCCSP335]